LNVKMKDSMRSAISGDRISDSLVTLGTSESSGRMPNGNRCRISSCRLARGRMMFMVRWRRAGK
jgi:hypothetical protein